MKWENHLQHGSRSFPCTQTQILCPFFQLFVIHSCFTISLSLSTSRYIFFHCLYTASSLNNNCRRYCQDLKLVYLTMHMMSMLVLILIFLKKYVSSLNPDHGMNTIYFKWNVEDPCPDNCSRASWYCPHNELYTCLLYLLATPNIIISALLINFQEYIIIY